jgi:hypothetical protein
MGVTVGDPDGDGDVDMIVTNDEGEPNNFFQQQPSRRFLDIADQTHLAKVSRAPLGFGAQMSDFNGDQQLDLFVANGHVIDYQEPGHEFAMHPQLFSFSTTWLEHPRASAGAYFEQKHVGRAVTLLDVQRDGWPDIAVTDMLSPSALLVNDSVPQGGAVVLELVAVRTPRDATGARITLTVHGKDQFRWVTSGDGYMASNEKKIWLTLPHGARGRLSVHWPSGAMTVIESVGSGEYLLREGDNELIERVKG